MSAGLVIVPSLFALLAGPARLDKLPDWAARVARETEAQTAPAEADAWVLLQRTELVYAGDGKVQARLLRVLRVLSERGLGERVLAVGGLAGKGSKLKRLKGWNARPDGDVEELTRNDAVSLDDGQSRVHTVAFARAVKGSLLVFESVVETEHPMGPVEVLPVMETEPVRQWALVTRSEKPGVEVRLDALHVAPWFAAAPAPGAGEVEFRDVPARPADEAAVPADRNALPWVQVRFQDASLRTDVPSNASWDALAAWTHAKYAARVAPTRQSAGGGADAAGVLRSIHDWMAEQMMYRQVYLTPERGWIPSPPDEVARRRYGDCKDLALLAISDARQAGLSAYPALARVFVGHVEDAEPPGMFAFNHVIVAVRLAATLGLPAEVEVEQGRFLLVDPTARLTPFGQLSDAHAGRRLLVCTEKGGIWITVPEAATQPARRRVKLDGRFLESEVFEGALEVSEDGSPEGLRAAALEGGLEALRKACLRLGLPADARCEVKEHSDPLRLDAPYRVVFSLEFKGAVRGNGTGEWTLDLPGMPSVPRSLLRAGRARMLPVASEGRDALEYELHVRTPWHFSAVAPAGQGETAFRTYAWKTIVRPGAGGADLEFHYSQQLRPRTFDFDQLDEGLAAWKKDRAAVQRLSDNGLALKVD